MTVQKSVEESRGDCFSTDCRSTARGDICGEIAPRDKGSEEGKHLRAGGFVNDTAASRLLRTSNARDRSAAQTDEMDIQTSGKWTNHPITASLALETASHGNIYFHNTAEA